MAQMTQMTLPQMAQMTQMDAGTRACRHLSRRVSIRICVIGAICGRLLP
jgi:hypothetical protein